uniref:Major facilitator superfamily (MFS) profile domain-containing protein n=1 Tax=Globisporangium ultimum (strain ATCC 200006 / CBS 805.95 / DAOM BR144) TaxID=431595 RepID=K3WAR4_GLOUD
MVSEANFQATPVYDTVDTPPYKRDSVVLVRDDGSIQDSAGGCSIAMMVLLSLPRMATNMAWAAQWAALGPYLGTMLPPYAVQLAQLIGPLSGILVAPTVGVLSDRSTNRYGRRRPYLLYGAITSSICWIMMGYTRDLGELFGDQGNHRLWTSLLTIFFYTWMDITVNVVQTPAILLIADFAGDRQTLGSGIGQASSTLGSIMVAGYIYFFGAAHLTLRWFLGMLSVTMITSVGIVCVFAKEIPRAKDPLDKITTCSRIVDAFCTIVDGLRTLPRVLIVYCIVFFTVQYGFTAYNGSKGQFFGVEVFDGDSQNADTCQENCTVEQNRYNEGVQLAGGVADMTFNIVGYVYSWVLPFLVARMGARWIVTLAIIPQALLMVMAFTKIVVVDVMIVVLTAITQATSFALIVPILIRVYGDGAEVGMHVGAVNSANCFGQLLNFAVSAALVETPLGYALPVFVGGVISFIGFLVSLFFFKIKMYSM